MAFLGRVRGEQEGRARAPAWWWSADDTNASMPPLDLRPVAPAPPPAPPPPAPPPVVELDPRLESLSVEEKAVIQLLRTNQSVRLSTIAQHTKKSPMRASGFMQQLVRKVFDLGFPCITGEVLPDNDRLYRYQDVDRGNR
jgi:hypothetical protein